MSLNRRLHHQHQVKCVYAESIITLAPHCPDNNSSTDNSFVPAAVLRLRPHQGAGIGLFQEILGMEGDIPGHLFGTDHENVPPST